MKLGNRYKIAKRLGPIFEKTQTKRFMLSKERSEKNKKRGGRRGGSDYSRQLLEKQKLRFTYGLSERQFSGYVAQALASKVPQATLFSALETRLDSIAYRLGLAPTRRAARQMASHGHLTVNGRKVTIPSYRVSQSDTISIREGSRQGAMFGGLSDRLKEHKNPAWLTFDVSSMEGRLIGEPGDTKEDTIADIGAVFEFYTR